MAQTLPTSTADPLPDIDLEKQSAEDKSSSIGDLSRTADENEDETESSEPKPEVFQEDPTLVVFDGPNDPENPKNWSLSKRIFVSAMMGLMTFVTTFSSSIFSVAIQSVSEEFSIDIVTSTLGVSLFLLGFVFGPIIWGPMSEVYGRKMPLFIGFAIFAIFQIPVAVATNTETIMIGRFISGFGAAAPIAIAGGVIADMWGPVERAYAVCAMATGGFTGPVAGPIVGGFVTQSYLGWRWTAWLTLILAAVIGIIAMLTVPESSAPRILQLRAKKLRFETKNLALHAKADETKVTLKSIFTVYLVRPFIMLAQEPVLLLITAYMSYLYGVVYLLFEGFPVSFYEQRGWNLGVSALPFCAFIVGIMFGCGMMVHSAATNFKRAYLKYGHAIPEERLPPMIIAAFILPPALFWYGWTSFPSITWVPQVISVGFIGAGLFLSFWQGINYIIDCYGPYSNSALAGNTFIRSIAGAVFPLFAPVLYRNLGVPWASSLLGFICLAFAPAPIIFYKYGARIRAESRWAPKAE